MGITVRLSEFIREMGPLSDIHSTYLNIRTGEFVMLSEEELRAAEEGEPLEDFPDWQQEALLKAVEVLSSQDFKPLPSKFDNHEYSIM